MAGTEQDERTERDRYNPGDLHAAELFNGRAAPSTDHTNGANSAQNSEAGLKDAVLNAEENPTGFVNNVTGSGNTKTTFRARLLGNKKALWGVGIGGTIGSLLIAAFLSLLPLKLEMFIQNISKQAEAIPAHAVGRRAEYLVTRALAVRAIQIGQGLDSNSADLVFCSTPGAIACSIFHTYTAKYFEDKMDFSFDKRTDGTVHLSVKPNGRNGLSGKATNWDITITRDMGEGNILETVKRIESNADMKAYISGRVEKMKLSNAVTRFLGRRILMKKYGVTNWRAFEKTSNKVADIRSSFKAAMYKNTIGRIMPRTAMYLACISGGEACDKLLKNYSDTIDPSKITDPKEKAQAEKVQEWVNKLKGIQAGTSVPDGLLTKVISSNVVKVLGGAVAIAGIADLGFRAINSVGNDHALDQIAYDINKTAYVGMAFGDQAGLVVNDERMKAGDIDMDVLGVASSYLDGAEQSPLMQAENGITTATSTTQVTRDCQATKTPSTSAAPTSDSYTYQPTTLEPGQLVCPEARLVRNYTKELDTNPAWGTLKQAASVWVSSVGLAFDVVNTLVGGAFQALGDVLTKIPGVSDAMKTLGSWLEPIMNWVVSLIFDIPNIGPNAPGANNYDALSGGIRVAQNELMEQGVDSSGKVNGGGGSVLNNTQVATILRQQQANDADYYNSQPVMARIFDPMLTGSFAQRFVAAMPTSFSSLAMLPALSTQSLLGASSASAADINTGIINPFGAPQYGYADNDPAMTASPGTYTPEACAASAKARDDSFGVHPEISAVATYTVNDPCALEKMVTGSLLNDAGVTDDPNSFPSLTDGLFPDTATTGGATAGNGYVAPDGWAFPTDSDATLAQPFIPGAHNAVDLAKNGDVPIFAARDGVVVSAGDISQNPPYVQPCTGPTGQTQQVVIIRHTAGSDTYYTSYHHLKMGSILVHAGETVKAGDKIAMMGETGCAFGQHLHFELWKNSIYGSNGVPIDPMTVLKRK